MKVKEINMFFLVMSVKFLFLVLNLNHLLVVMLIFEFMGLKVLFLFIVLFFNNMVFISLVLLVFLACEASLGLCLLVGVVRCKYMKYVENSSIFVV